jgi:hypothetical protein
VGHRAYFFGKAQLDAIVSVFDDFLSGPIASGQPRSIVLFGGAAQTGLIAGLLQCLPLFCGFLLCRTVFQCLLFEERLTLLSKHFPSG